MLARLVFLIRVCSYINGITSLELILPLNGDEWLLSNSTMDGVSCKVPGGVYTALLDDGILNDPYFRNHDTEYFWVGRSDWAYSRNFKVETSLLNKQEIILVCNGLDTISRIYVNGRSVGKSDNMFVRYTFDIKNALKKSADAPNEIMINFTSAVTYGEERAKTLDKKIPPECPPSSFHGECHGNLVRKTQCAFSWDWGPAFVSQGIWQDIFIVAYDKLIITDVTTSTEKGQKSWKLHVKVFTRAVRDVHVQGLVRAHLAGIDSQWEQSFTGTSLESIDIEGILIPNDAVEMWWPRGYGQQRLYNLTVEILDGQLQVLSTKIIKIGFRTVELVEDPLPGNSNGLTFFFKVNDQPIFLKGSNWIPADSFLERVSHDRLRNYMTSAVDANMNCLRVWGGGIYETDYFYDLADELGILIWQDFMYACALYPTDDVFLSSVQQEVTYQVRRLKNHPSLLAYSGNNENELGLKGWWGVGNDQRYIDDYLTLYVATIKRLLDAEDPGRPFMLSSPSNGAETVKQGGISNFPSSNLYGDIHDYNYGRRFWDAGAYSVPRMASEYGLQSFPSAESLSSVYADADMRYGSELNAYRQHHAGGNQQMLNLIEMYLLPPNGTDERQKFSDLIYCTQIVHAVAMRTETEHYRRWQSQLTNQGEGHTMGALYWMFADIWQAPSWASIEYGGKWKMLHYFARKFFAPILISPYIDNSDLKVFLVVDELPTFDRNDPLEIELELHPVITEDERPFNLFALRYLKL